MGSYISLRINKMEIDWGKNYNFRNHSKLFQEKDHGNNIPYYTVDDNDKEFVEYGLGAKKKLYEVKERLDLLGYSLKEIEQLYNNIKEGYEFYMGEKVNLSFDDFSNFIKSLDLLKVNHVASAIENYDNGYDLGEYFKECLLGDKEFANKMKRVLKKLKKHEEINECFYENIEPYIILRLLAENPENLNYDVIWDYNEVVEAGWTRLDFLKEGLEDSDKLLIVTEGKSDSFIIKRTLDEIFPNIQDFFEFIDMEENYPFTGVGNLLNFSKGLSKIKIQNKIIVLFDNDTAGNEIYNKVKEIQKPDNLVFCHLPLCNEFNQFLCIGPSGTNFSNINGKAVAIECFLDFNSVAEKPMIIWTSYNKNMKQYQGELVNKDRYVNSFKKSNLKSGYDVKKLKMLIKYIVESWINRFN